jgi:hypothetical protein
MLMLSFSAQVVAAQTSASISQANGEEPEFVLVGTSRIGSRYSATLQLRSGKQIIVVSEKGEAVPLLGMSGYTVAQIEPKRVLIRHWSNSTCAALTEQEVVCAADTTTALELNIRTLEGVNDPDSGHAVIRVANDLTDIPAAPGSFIDRLQTEAAQRAERPEVPNGMELIKTSSGFQLIPDD